LFNFHLVLGMSEKNSSIHITLTNLMQGSIVLLMC
jgi:hypothetical protein